MSDADFMRHALDAAHEAECQGEVPVGAVLVYDHEIISRGYNQTISLHDPTAHAEIMALRRGGEVLKNYRFVDTSLYVTLEPCLMCYSALVHARVKRVVFGAFDPKTGSCGSRFNAQSLEFFNHRFELIGGVLHEECGMLLQQFFALRRSRV